MRERVAVIDADSIAYFSSKDTLEESLANLDKFIPLILNRTKCTKYVLFLSARVKEYFRKKIFEGYKAKRPKTQIILKYLNEVKATMFDKYHAITIVGVEADDLVALAAKQYSGDYTVVVCSPDKDVLKTIPGRHFNYKTHKFIDTTIDEAIEFIWLQCLHGDSTDGIVGIPGIGPAKAIKLLYDGVLESDSRESKFAKFQINVFNAYLSYYKRMHLAIFEFSKNFRLVYLLRDKEEYLREIGYELILPEPFSLED